MLLIITVFCVWYFLIKVLIDFFLKENNDMLFLSIQTVQKYLK